MLDLESQLGAFDHSAMVSVMIIRFSVECLYEHLTLSLPILSYNDSKKVGMVSLRKPCTYMSKSDVGRNFEWTMEVNQNKENRCRRNDNR